MKKPIIYLSTVVLLTACATTSPQSTQQQSIHPHCQRDYPKPAVTADNFDSPEMVEWVNHQLECQKRQ